MKKQYRTCISCDKTLKQVSRPTRLVVPISLYRVGLQLHKVLRGYKDEPIDKLRESFFLQVAALLHRFIRDHRGCIARAAGVDWNVITSIPSSQGRAGQHPLEQAIRLSKLLGPEYDTLLSPGSEKVKWNKATDKGYVVTKAVHDKRVLLIDDTFTTGAHVQSAASALQKAGARVVAVLVTGRVIDVDFGEENKPLWERQWRKAFSFATCCLE
jgi:predicted amidophosphoribosyltransferase